MTIETLMKNNPLRRGRVLSVLEKSVPNATRSRIHDLLDYIEEDELIPPVPEEDEYGVIDMIAARALQIGMVDLDIGRSGMRRIANLFTEDEPAEGEYNFVSAVRDYDAGKQVWITFLPKRGPKNYTASLEPQWGEAPEGTSAYVSVNFNKIIEDVLAVL